MKKSLLLFIAIIFASSIYAQDEKPKNNELGINATSFIKEFFSLNSADVDEGPYMITYKKHKGNNAFRLGLGGQFSQLNEDIDGGGKLTTKDNFVALRVGYEWTKSVAKRWNIYYGLDVITDFSQSASQTTSFLSQGQIEDTELKTQSISFGGGPVLGIQFFISKNISLVTEGSLYYKYTSVNEKQIFQIQSQFNKDDKSSNQNFDFGLPTALFFVIRF